MWVSRIQLTLSMMEKPFAVVFVNDNVLIRELMYIVKIRDAREPFSFEQTISNKHRSQIQGE